MLKKYAQRTYRPNRQISKTGTSSIRQAMMNHRKKLQLSPEVIQRAIGFEIEISYRPFRDKNHHDTTLKHNIPVWASPYKPYEKNEVLLEGEGFNVCTDISFYNLCPYLEIITDPFEEGPQGFQKLKHVFTTFELMMTKLTQAARENSQIGFKDIFWQFGKIQPQNKDISLWSYKNPDIGLVQVTAGIDLAKIPFLFQDWAWPSNEEDKTLLKRRAPGRKIFAKWESRVLAYLDIIEIHSYKLVVIFHNLLAFPFRGCC